MGWSRRLEKRLALASVFGIIDRRLGNRLSPEQAVVISGFWRSGTTFLMQAMSRALRARSVFEPLQFRVPEARPFFGATRFEDHGRTTGEIVPYIRPNASSHVMDEFLSDVLTGRVSTPWTRKARLSGTIACRQIVVKLVRGNLLAAYLQQRFACRVLLLMRHPCGVIASLRRVESTLGIFGSEKFIQILLDDAALAEDHLAPHREAIERWRQISPLTRLALAHAITHLVPLVQIERDEFDPTFVLYEELTLNKSGILAGLTGTSATTPDSFTTESARRGASPDERCFSWKKELSRKEIDTVYAVYESFGAPLTERLAEIDLLERQRLT